MRSSPSPYVAGFVALAALGLVGAARPDARAPRPSGPSAQACPFVVARADGVPPIPREFRAAWVSPVEEGEWPSSPDLSDAEHQQELRDLLDRAVAVGLNTVILHMRPAADALYASRRVPWSSYLVRDGRRPGYDPLAFALDEAHRRGLHLHVWFNPFRAAPPQGGLPAVGADRLTGDHPDWVVRYGSQRWIDPGDPEARRAALDDMLEVVDRYDVDGVHLDDYFYPYLEERTWTERVPERVAVRTGRGRRARTVRRTVYRTVRRSETIRFPDDRTWARYGQPAGFASRGDWRRENVSQFVRALYEGVKARKPWVQVGISPFGIWRPGAPAGLTGLDAYGEIFADSRRWWREGWADYLAPQLYWSNDNDQRRNQRLDAWWRTENVRGRHLYPGMLTMRVASGSNRWPASEIERQIAWYRDQRAGSPEALGHVHFRLKSLLEEAPGDLGDRLAAGLYADRTLPPATPWLGADVPGGVRFTGCSGGARAAIGVEPTGDSARARWWAVQWRDASGRWTTRAVSGGARVLPAHYADGSTPTAVAVRAISPTGVEGAPLVLTATAAAVGSGQ